MQLECMIMHPDAGDLGPLGARPVPARPLARPDYWHRPRGEARGVDGAIAARPAAPPRLLTVRRERCHWRELSLDPVS